MLNSISLNEQGAVKSKGKLKQKAWNERKYQCNISRIEGQSKGSANRKVHCGQCLCQGTRMTPGTWENHVSEAVGKNNSKANTR